MLTTAGRVFLTEGTACAKALSQKKQVGQCGWREVNKTKEEEAEE